MSKTYADRKKGDKALKKFDTILKQLSIKHLEEKKYCHDKTISEFQKTLRFLNDS